MGKKRKREKTLLLFFSFFQNIIFCAMCCIFSSSCTAARMGSDYLQQYSYLRQLRTSNQTADRFLYIHEKDVPEYFLIINVDAPHLNYRDFHLFISSLQRGLFFERDPTIGHAWIVLGGKTQNGQKIYFEGGHTGELGLSAPRYFDEIIRRASNRSVENPIQYIYQILPDGFLEEGSGAHMPTCSALFPLSQHAFLSCLSLIISQEGYDFSSWALMKHNCVTFVSACLSRADIESHIPTTSMNIPQYLNYNATQYRLWTNACFSHVSIVTVDALEEWLWTMIESQRAQNAAKWYNLSWKKLKKKYNRLFLSNDSLNIDSLLSSPYPVNLSSLSSSRMETAAKM